jgi:hypothetical protein
MVRDLEEYLQQEIKEGKIDFVLRASESDGGIKFYIHPLGKDGSTMDFEVIGNGLTTLSDTKKTA